MMADSFLMAIPTTLDDLPVNLSSSFSSNFSSNYSTNSINRTKDSAAIVVPVVFAIIFIFGLVGNATLIFIVLRNKPMRTKPNVLILNLSIGDFILIIFSVPFTSVIFTFYQWEFGNVICKLNEFTQTLSLGVSIFTLTALSVDRFIAVVYPLASYSSKSLTRAIVASVDIWVIWVISVGLALVDLVGAHAGSCPNCVKVNPIIICNLHPKEWADQFIDYHKFRVIFRFIVYFIAPMIVITCLYVIIASVLLRQSASLSSQMDVKASSPSSPSVSRASRPRPRLQRSESVAEAEQNDSRKKVAKVVLSVVDIFIVCWLPRHVYLLHYYFVDFEWRDGWYYLKFTTFCLMFIYSAINPLALYLLNGEYRRYFHHYLFGCCYKPWRLSNTVNRRGTTTDSIRMHRMTTTMSVSLDEDKIEGCQINSSTRL